MNVREKLTLTSTYRWNTLGGKKTQKEGEVDEEGVDEGEEEDVDVDEEDNEEEEEVEVEEEENRI